MASISFVCMKHRYTNNTPRLDMYALLPSYKLTPLKNATWRIIEEGGICVDLFHIKVKETI